MKPMTHSEIRGTLLLLALMLVIVGATALWRGSIPAGRAAAKHPEVTGSVNTDSLLLERQVRKLETEDSHGQQERHLQRKSPADTSAGRRSPRRAESKRRPLPSPAPSPLDRPAPVSSPAD